jgi:hypothetical protein
MKKLLYWLLGLSLATLWLLNFSAGIIGGIWLITIGSIWFVISALILSFIMPFIYSIAFLPSLIFIPLLTKAMEKGNRFFTVILGLILGGYNNFLLAYWVLYVFNFIVMSNNLPLIPTLLFGYAIAMGPIGYMAQKEGPDAGSGTTFGVLFVQIAYFILSVNLLLGESPDVGYLSVWILLIIYTVLVGALLGISYAPSKNKTENNIGSEGNPLAEIVENKILQEDKRMQDLQQIQEDTGNSIIVEDNQSLKNELKQSISEKTKVLLDLTEKIEQLKLDLVVIKQEYEIKIGRLYLKLDGLNLEILKQKKISDFLEKGGNLSEAKKIADEETKEQKEKIEQDHARINEEEKELKKKLPAEEERELKALWKDLVKKFHPDLALDPKDRKAREEKMKIINEAYHNKDTEKLRNIIKDKVIEEDKDVSAEMLQERFADILKAIGNLEDEYAELIKSEWNTWKVNIAKAKKRNRDLFKELEAKIVEEISEKEKDLKEIKSKNNK